MEFIDLHVHSNFSDGVNSPEENIELAKKIGLKAITLSDHDTVKGVPFAEKKAKELGIEFIRGIEISTFDDDTISIHMLGLMWKDEKPFLKVEEDIALSRNLRNIKIYEGLKEMFGFDISLEEMKKYSRSTIIGRGHLSRALVDKGYVIDYKEADSKIRQVKGVGGSYGIRIEDAINVTHSSGGLAIIAHPYSLKKDDDTLFKKIKNLKDNHGLDGIECYHSRHSNEQIELYLSFAKKLDLLISGGSDYHGSYKPEIALGRGKSESFIVPYHYLERMKEYHAKNIKSYETHKHFANKNIKDR